MSRTDWDVDAREAAWLDRIGEPVECDGDGWVHGKRGCHLPDEPHGLCSPCPGCDQCIPGGNPFAPTDDDYASLGLEVPGRERGGGG